MGWKLSHNIETSGSNISSYLTNLKTMKPKFQDKSAYIIDATKIIVISKL